MKNVTYLIRLSSDCRNPTSWYSAAIVSDSDATRARRAELMALLAANPDIPDLAMHSHASSLEILKGASFVLEAPEEGDDDDGEESELDLIERIDRVFTRIESSGLYALRIGERNTARLRRLVAFDTHDERLVIQRHDAPYVLCMDDDNREVFSSPSITALDVRDRSGN
jgi:hypothetical protein